MRKHRKTDGITHTRRWVLAALFTVTLAIPLITPGLAVASAPPSIGDPNGVLTSVAPNPTGLGHWIQEDRSHWSYNDNEPYIEAKGRTVARDAAPSYKDKDTAGTIVPNPVGSGYWIVTSDGKVSRRGAAADICADMSKCSGYDYRNDPIETYLVGTNIVVAAAATPSGKGLWVVDEAGAVWTAGDAKPYGDVQKKRYENNQPVGIFSSATGHGYTILLQEGGVHTFGDARYFGHGGTHGEDAVGIAPSYTPAGGVDGYWIVNAKGRVTAFGDAPHLGNASSGALVTGIATLPGRRGYLIVRRDGTTQRFSEKPQRWVEIQTGGYYLRVTGYDVGTQIHGKLDHGTDSTMWREIPVSGGYQLVNALSRLCLDTAGGSVTQKTCANVPTQVVDITEKTPGHFVVKTVAGGLQYVPTEYAYLRAVATATPSLVEWEVAPVIVGPVSLADKSGLVLDVEAESHESGARVIGWRATGRPNQNWAVQIGGPGGYQLKNQLSSLCLDDNGGLAVQRPCNGSASQSFVGTRIGNKVILETKHGYLTFDEGPGGVPRAVMNPHADQATQWVVTAR